MFGKWSLIFEVRWGFIFQLHDLAASWEWVWFAFSALEYYLGVMVASIFVGYMEGVCKNHFFLLKVLIILPCLVRILWFPSVMCVARKIFLMDLGLHFWWDSIFLGFVFRELKFSSCPIFSFWGKPRGMIYHLLTHHLWIEQLNWMFRNKVDHVSNPNMNTGITGMIHHFPKSRTLLYK